MPTRDELKALSQTRLKEAKTQYDTGLYDGASYLAGYVVKLALKTRLGKILDLNVPEAALEALADQNIPFTVVIRPLQITREA